MININMIVCIFWTSVRVINGLDDHSDSFCSFKNRWINPIMIRSITLAFPKTISYFASKPISTSKTSVSSNPIVNFWLLKLYSSKVVSFSWPYTDHASNYR